MPNKIVISVSLDYDVWRMAKAAAPNGNLSALICEKLKQNTKPNFEVVKSNFEQAKSEFEKVSVVVSEEQERINAQKAVLLAKKQEEYNLIEANKAVERARREEYARLKEIDPGLLSLCYRLASNRLRKKSTSGQLGPDSSHLIYQKAIELFGEVKQAKITEEELREEERGII